jgi:hypothetical protein
MQLKDFGCAIIGIQTMIKASSTIKLLALSLFVGALTINAAQAQDYFAHITPGGKEKATTPAPPMVLKEEKPIQGSLAMMSRKTPIVVWFESFDKTEFTMKATDSDRTHLTRPFEKKAERVEEWTQTANKVAKNYRLLASTIRQMDVPENAPGLKDYRDLSAGWYADVALLYEDMIRPRKPSKTIEELDGQVHEIDVRSSQLASQKKNLSQMDLSLRKTYSVHMPKETDALFQYVESGHQK